MDVWLKSLPSEMSPEGSLPKAGFHRAFTVLINASFITRKANMQGGKQNINSSSLDWLALDSAPLPEINNEPLCSFLVLT